MTWSAGGAQTGTDTDLSGLSSVNGVTVTTFNDLVVYECDNSVELTVAGTLTIDPEFETVIMERTPGANNNALVVLNGGTLNIGTNNTENSFERAPQGDAIIFENVSTNNAFNFNANWANFRVDSGGTLNWRGGTIYSNGVIEIAAGSTVNIESQNCIMHGRDSNNSGNAPQIRQRSVNTNITGLTTIDFTLTMIGIPSEFSGYNPIHAAKGIDMSNNSTSNSFYPVRDYVAGQGNEVDAGMKTTTWLRFINCSLGSDLIVQSQNPGAGSDQDGLVETRQEVTYTITEQDGTPIENCRIFCRDTDNGNRAGANEVGTSASYIPDETYNGLTNASGVLAFTTDGGVLLAVEYHGDEAGTTTFDFDSRGKNDDRTDRFDFGFAAYGFLPAVQELELKGNGGNLQTFVLFADTGTEETNEATVAAYTELNDGNEFYDACQEWLASDSDNMEEVGLGNALAVRSGMSIDLGVYDLVIDSGAASALAVDEGTDVVTIDPGAGAFATTARWNTIIAPQVSVETDTSIDGWTVDGDLLLNNANPLNNVTVTGNLRIDTGADSTLAFDNVTVQGNVFNDAGGNTLQINATNSTLSTTEPGIGNGEVDLQNQVNVLITNVTRGTAVSVVADETAGGFSEGEVIASGYADASGQLSSSVSYTDDVAVSIRARNQGICVAAIADDGGVFTDQTNEANSASADDMDLLPVSPALNDAYYFGAAEQFSRLRIDVTDANGAGSTIAWEYWDGDSWESLTGLSDGTSNFETLGDNIVSFTIPGDWTQTTVNGQGSLFYVRARLSVVGSAAQTRARKVKMDTTRYLRFSGAGTLTSAGLTASAVWIQDTISKFHPSD